MSGTDQQQIVQLLDKLDRYLERLGNALALVIAFVLAGYAAFFFSTVAFLR
jgi:hypothetical protein